jgi:hypothetical protein
MFVDAFRNPKTLESRQDLQKRHAASSAPYVYQFQGVGVIVNDQDDKCVKDGLREFAQDIIDGLESRFPDASGSILEAFDIFHIEDLPTTERCGIKSRRSMG